MARADAAAWPFDSVGSHHLKFLGPPRGPRVHKMQPANARFARHLSFTFRKLARNWLYRSERFLETTATVPVPDGSARRRRNAPRFAGPSRSERYGTVQFRSAMAKRMVR